MLAFFQAAVTLWCRGAWESIQLQRCVVFFVLDPSRAIWGKVLHCFLLNGGIFLGSVIWWHGVILPGLQFVLQHLMTPISGTLFTQGVELLLHLLYQVCWLMPAYVVTLLVSCIWYQQIAVHALHVKQQQQGSDKNNPGVATSMHKGQGLENVAQELYRVILFLVFYMEIMLLQKVPFVGPALYFIFLCWLYAYYCYDYKWSIQAVRLPERLACIEQHWAFFAGFGMPLACMTCFLSFFVGAAVLAVAFPLFILVACESQPGAYHGHPHLQLGQVPIFKLALWPTQTIIRCIFKTHKA